MQVEDNGGSRYAVNFAKRIVVKVGTSTITYENGKMNHGNIDKLCRGIADIWNSGREVILVTSGAIGVGIGSLDLPEKPDDIPQKQAIAAVGQCELMNIYDREFSKFNHTVAQLLVTRDVISNKTRHENAFNTLHRLLEMNIVPIINANDTVSIEQLDFDENDTLSAVMAQLCEADLLVILTDVDGLYDRNPSDPDAKHIPLVTKLTDEMISSAKQKGSELASGGMITKLEAASIAGENGIPTVIINGDDPEKLYGIFDGTAKYTLFDLA